MREIHRLLGLISMTILLSACNTPEANHSDEIDTGNPSVEEILSEDEDADIFLFNGIVYRNAEQIEWVANEDLTFGVEVLEIEKQTDNRNEFTNGVATKLPVGTKIFEKIGGKGDILIAIVGGEEIRYLGMREG